MNELKRMKVNRKTVPFLIIAILASTIGISVIAEQVIGGWFFDKTDPANPPASGVVDETITITELIEFMQIEVTITGSGEIGTEHNVNYTITNIGVMSLTSGKYSIAFDPPNEDPNEYLAQNVEIGTLAPSEFIEGFGTWTPALVGDYTAFVNVFDLLWT